MPEVMLDDDSLEEGEKYNLTLNVLFNSFSNLNIKKEVAMVTVHNSKYKLRAGVCVYYHFWNDLLKLC